MSDFPPPPPDPGSTPPPPPPPSGLTPPPGYVAYQGAPTPTGTLSRVLGLKKVIVILSIVTAVGSLLTAVLTSTVRGSADDFLAGRLSEDDFIADYAPVLIGQLVQSVGQFALAIVSIIWLFRVAKNVRLFGRNTTWAPIWAVFGWVLPPVLIIIPFLMVREMWKASDPESPYGTDTWKQSGESSTVIIWFVLYGVLSTVLAVLQVGTLFGQGFGGGTDSLAETVNDFGGLTVASTVVIVLAAGAWAMTVREITERHVRLTGER